MISFVLVFLAVGLVYSRNALHMFQQNRYEIKRYTGWLFDKKNLHLSYIFLYFTFLFVSLFFKGFVHKAIVFICSAGFAAFFIYQESKKTYIKDLVFTGRVKRQIAFLSVLEIPAYFLLVKVFSFKIAIAGFFAVYLPYILIYPMALITYPLEEGVKKHYENQARNILSQMYGLTSIGITGSYGKTTTKNIIKDILSDHFYTLMTPASYNTPMGITRTVREMMKPTHEVFVCEMGADHVGEITYLMDFVKPKYGVLTSIGPQHLNTFGNLDNIIKEKMEVIERLPVDGVGIINIDNEYIASYKIKNNCKIVKVSLKDPEADFYAHDLSFSKTGCAFIVDHEGCSYEFSSDLLGEHNVMNLLEGIALGIQMGVKMEDLISSVSAVRRVSHRLELKKINGYTFIDNAFNSNPVGCKQSLDVLKGMDGKRVIVTPGLIDLGKEEDRYNYEFGAYMKDRADDVILVGARQTESINNGLRDSGFDMERVIVLDTVKEAFGYLYAHFDIQDTILLENDLPDAFSK